MAKLNGVQTLDMQNGDITRIEYEGAVYTKVDGESKPGDVLLRISNTLDDLAYIGNFYECTTAGESGEKYGRTWYISEEGGRCFADAVKFAAFRKASEAPQVSQPFAGLVLAKVAEVERKVAEIEAKMAPKREALKVGDYAVIIGDDVEKLEIADVVQIRSVGNRYDFRVFRLTDDRNELFNADELRKATDEEVAQAKKEAVFTKAGRKPNEYRKGDIVRVISGKSHSLLAGDVGIITELAHGFYRVTVSGKRDAGNLVNAEQLEIVCYVEDRKDVA